MTMLKHTFSTPVERALEDVRANDYPRQPLAMEGLFTTNPRFASRAARLYIPEGHPIGALVTDVLGDDFLLGVVENASYLRRWAGTELAVKRIADMVGAGYSYTVTGNDIAFKVSPLRGSGEFNAEQIDFLTTVFQTVVPFYLTASIAEIVDEFNAPPLYAGAGVNLVDVINRSP